MTIQFGSVSDGPWLRNPTQEEPKVWKRNRTTRPVSTPVCSISQRITLAVVATSIVEPLNSHFSCNHTMYASWAEWPHGGDTTWQRLKKPQRYLNWMALRIKNYKLLWNFSTRGLWEVHRFSTLRWTSLPTALKFHLLGNSFSCVRSLRQQH